MDKSTRELIQALKELETRSVQYFPQRDNREGGAFWPAHNSQDLPDTDWYLKDPE